MLTKFRLAILQTACSTIKKETLQFVKNAIADAAKQGGQVCVLGETFNTLYVKSHLVANAEDFSDQKDSETLALISNLAQEYGVYVIGTIPEKESTSQKLYNTAFCFNEEGKMIAKYRKSHLFDIDIPNAITYKESETFAPGNSICVFDTIFGRFGLGVCYDIRFPELSQTMREKGAQMLIFPGAFNQTTGPLHWELLLRSRACDNQLYTVGVSTATYELDRTVYQAWGHSTIVDPYGRVLCKAGSSAAVLLHEVDFGLCDQIRTNIPVFTQRRKDMYELITKV